MGARVTFEEYVVARGQALVRLATLLTGDAHRAHDLVQDVLADAFVRWRRIAGQDPDAYVRRMLINANRSWWRRRSNREVVSGTFPDRARHDDTASEAVERAALWELIRQLPRQQRAVVVLRYYEDLDDRTIAQIIGRSEATVRTHAMRALRSLRDKHTVVYEMPEGRR